MSARKKASKTRPKSTRKAQKSRTAPRKRVSEARDKDDEIDGCDCDFSENITLDDQLPAAKGAVEVLRTSRRRSGRARSARA